MGTEMLISWAIILVGATVQGLTGLGFALVSVPVLILFQDPRSVVVTMLLLSSLLNALIFLQARHQVTLRDAGPITLGSVLGVPLGSYLLAVLSPESLKLMVSLLVLGFAIPLLAGYTRQFSHPRMASLVTGAVSGALQSSTSMGGPPVALFLTNLGLSKENFRGTMVIRSLAASTLSVLALLPTGILNSGVAAHALLLVPAMVAGFFIGSRLMKVVRPDLFKRLTVLLVAGTALVGLAGNLL